MPRSADDPDGNGEHSTNENSQHERLDGAGSRARAYHCRDSEVATGHRLDTAPVQK